MTIQIIFDISYELYNESKNTTKFKNNILNGLIESIKINSFKNTPGDIISDVIGIIYLSNCNIKIKKNNILNIQFDVNLSNPNIDVKIDTIEEIIWSIMPSVYDELGILKISVDGAYRCHYYNLKILNTPQNIIFNIDC